MKLWKEIKQKMALHPAQRISDDERTVTYSEMINTVEIFSAKIKGYGCCGIMCTSELNCAIALLGCFAAGVTAVPLSWRYGQAHCDRIIKKISPNAIVYDDSEELCIKKAEESEYVEPENHPALIMCTSGTTGQPKGAMLSEENIMTNIGDIIKYFPVNSDDRILISRSLYHCAVLVGEMLVSLFIGAEVNFYSDSFNPLMINSLINAKHISIICGTPTLIRMLACMNGKNETTIRLIGVSGECMNRQTAATISGAFQKAEIFHYYGLTEASPRVCFLPPEKFRTHPEYVGVPLASVRVKVVGDGCRTARANEEGMLWVKGKNVMIGYYNDSALTEKTIRNGWLCTGDTAVIDEKGFVKILGRRDELIIKSGMNIYPAEIECAMRCDERVREIVAYSFLDKSGNTKIGIRISGEFLDSREVRTLCEKVLPLYERPSEIVLLPELPRNGSGKLIRGRIIR